MGLDMYLTARKFIPSKYNEEGKALSQKIKLAIGDDMGGFEVEGLTISLMYWRKANAIHAWFVANVQNGIDDCKEAYVEKTKLEQLLALVSAALLNRDGSVLPPTSGFFFGSTDIDEWYWGALEETETELRRVIDWLDEGQWSVYYQSSW